MARRASSGFSAINYNSGDQSLLDSLKPLWEALNTHHHNLSVNFKPYYEEMTFKRRKASLLKKAKSAKMQVDVAEEELSGQNIGYCISSVDSFKIGEIYSIFVGVVHRGLGIGDALVRRALAWMEKNGAEEKVVQVAAGNEDAFDFYARYGFLVRKTLLKQVEV